LFDQLVDQDGKVFAKAALAVAADAVGDRSDRDSLLKSLSKAPNQSEEPELEDYGTPFRDQLAALALLGEAGLFKHPAAEDYLTTNLPILALTLVERRLTTQEEAWALRLSAHLGSGEVSHETFGDLAWSAEDNPQVSTADFDGQKGIRNAGDAPLLVSLWQAGAPADTSTVVSDGISIERVMLDMDNLQPVTNPAPGQRVLVSVVGTAFVDERLDYVVADLLPSGFEVEQTGLPSTVIIGGGRVGDCQNGENTLVPGICTTETGKAFQQTGTEYAEARADRVLFGFKAQKEHFALYYVMRRTQAGHVTQPGAYGEAMYRPELRARAASRLIR
jgi:uncharacterized protein YfaS (alpha-2-macroglobulin family)